MFPPLPLIHPADHLSHAELKGDERTVVMRDVPGTTDFHLQQLKKEKPEDR